MHWARGQVAIRRGTARKYDHAQLVQAHCQLVCLARHAFVLCSAGAMVAGGKAANAIMDKESRFKAEHCGSALKKGEGPARACLRLGRRLIGFLAAP